ncbi:unnamed protein product [Thlaspi arvense]|uniref:Uncharacterized protein n=1 Tax=Thlaspi arvense TaxID=13288 RepID=A0AAU9SJ73_THLAR|nr:unnamed protein product [Thlaspi arvense]
MVSIKHFFLLFICFSALLTSGLAGASPSVDCNPDFTNKDCDRQCKKNGSSGGHCGPDLAEPRLQMCFCNDI